MIRNAFGARLGAISLLMSSIAASAATPGLPGAIEHAELLATLSLKGQMWHVQGVELDNSRIWVTSVDRGRGKGYIHEFDRATGTFLRRLELTDGLRYHPGGISLHGASIWVPLAEMTPDSSSVLVEIDKDTLQIRRKIAVADHLGCVAAAGDKLIAANWNSRLLYIFDLTNDEPVRTLRNPTQTRYQDMKLVGNQLVASGYLTGQSGTIDWFDWQDMRLTRTLRTGATDRSSLLRSGSAYTGKGMKLDGRDLYLVPEDGPSRMFHFRLDEAAAVSLPG